MYSTNCKSRFFSTSRVYPNRKNIRVVLKHSSYCNVLQTTRCDFIPETKFNNWFRRGKSVPAQRLLKTFDIKKNWKITSLHKFESTRCYSMSLNSIMFTMLTCHSRKLNEYMLIMPISNQFFAEHYSAPMNELESFTDPRCIALAFIQLLFVVLIQNILPNVERSSLQGQLGMRAAASRPLIESIFCLPVSFTCPRSCCTVGARPFTLSQHSAPVPGAIKKSSLAYGAR